MHEIIGRIKDRTLRRNASLLPHVILTAESPRVYPAVQPRDHEQKHQSRHCALKFLSEALVLQSREAARCSVTEAC